jgi:hypothetical protein
MALLYLLLYDLTNLQFSPSMLHFQENSGSYTDHWIAARVIFIALLKDTN